tara:strand:- start:3369 stop:3668 length:300 start_codon:yes stop_codon:yes gene_type:complete
MPKPYDCLLIAQGLLDIVVHRDVALPSSGRAGGLRGPWLQQLERIHGSSWQSLLELGRIHGCKYVFYFWALPYIAAFGGSPFIHIFFCGDIIRCCLIKF